MVDPRDRDGADGPDAGDAADGRAPDEGADAADAGAPDADAPGGDSPAASEPEFGSSDWFYHQLSGGRRRARQPEPADAGAGPAEPVVPPLPASAEPPVAEPPVAQPPVVEPAMPSFDPQFPDTTAPFTPPEPTPAADATTGPWSILDVPVTPAEPPEPVSPAEPKLPTGPIVEPGAPFVWNLKPGVGSDPLVVPPVEPASDEAAPPTVAFEPPAAPASDEAAPPTVAFEPPAAPASDEAAPPTMAFPPPAFVPLTPEPQDAPTVPQPAVSEPAQPASPYVPEAETQAPEPWAPAPLVPPVFIPQSEVPEEPGGSTPPEFPAQAAASTDGTVAEPESDDNEGDGLGLAALLGMFEEPEPGSDQPEADASTPPAVGAPREPTPEPFERVAPAYFEPAPLPPTSFTPDAPDAPVAPVAAPESAASPPDAAPAVPPIEGPRFPTVPGVVPPPPVGATGAIPPIGATGAIPPGAAGIPPLGAAAAAARFDADDDADDEGIDDLAGTPSDEASARAAAADTATVLMDAAAIDAALSDAEERPAEHPAGQSTEQATLLMGGIPSPATQALDAESLAEASAPTVAMAPASAAAAAAAAGPDDVLPTSRRTRSGAPGDGTPPGSPNNPNRTLFWVAGGLLALLILIALFVFGTRLPSMFAASTPSPKPSASATTKTTPSAAPKPTVIPKPAAAQPAGEHKWSTLGGGECIQPFTTPWAETFVVVDCATPHAAQMVYTNLFSADPAAPYPGATALANQINVLCTKPGVVNLQAASAYPDLQLQGTYPATEQQWKDGFRSYYCFASRSAGQPITGSVAGPGPTG